MELQARPGRAPSEMVGRLWTILGIFIPVGLPIAALYQRKARREADESNGQWVWRRTLANRPVLLYLVVWTALFALTFILMGVFAALGIQPI